MRFFVAVTDNAWFRYLAALKPDEVNFWQPSGRARFSAVRTGGPFLFKLHSPLNYIVGGGFFVRHSFLPLSIAWDAFGEKNGAKDHATLRTMILSLRAGEAPADPTIGCIVLAEPFFLPEDRWIPVPSDWSANIVRGKTYDMDDPIGASLWQQVRVNMIAAAPAQESGVPVAVAEETPRYGSDYLTHARLGQGAFRVLVTEAYQRRCAMTGEKTLPVLQAAHIKPFAESGPHRISNGILLRADLHILLERGYLTLTQELRMEASRRIKEDFDNGDQYVALHGKPLCVVPDGVRSRPSPEFIRWHNENRFLGG